MIIATKYIGKPISRVDGKAKVTGSAKYAAEFGNDAVAYGVVISSPIAKGKIISIDTEEAMSLPGVFHIFSHENVPGLAFFNSSYADQDSAPGKHFRPLHSADIMFSQQPIALVVAETFELANYASTLVRFEFESEIPVADLKENIKDAHEPKGKKTGFKKPKSSGKFDKVFPKAPVKIETEYFLGTEHHNPMEMHASTVLYGKNDKLTIYDKTQGVLNSQAYVKSVFNLSKKKVHVLSPFVGGGFGSGLRPQYQLFMTVLAALQLKRSITVTLTRQQMFSFGHRPATLQRLALGADINGRLLAMKHEAFAETSFFEDYMENVVIWGGTAYKCENIKVDYQLVNLNTYTPLDMRAPGAATGVLALECAMDELAYKLNMDPLELRLKNYTHEDPSKKKPFSSKALNECYRQAAEKFGWQTRRPEPRSTKEGNHLIGWGMATGIWDAMQMPSKTNAVLYANGKLEIETATADIGTGTYTIMTQIAAETLGLNMEDVNFKLGDSDFPYAYLEGGSATAGSTGTAVQMVCESIQEKLLKLAQSIDDSPLEDAKPEEVKFEDGRIILVADSSTYISIKDIFSKTDTDKIEEKSAAMPNMLKQRKYAINTHSAVFAEVAVDEDLGTITVRRVVSAVAAGRILNPKTARSQVLGGIVWGISMALQEESIMDTNIGRYMNHNFAEYHIPVNKDMHDIEVIFVEEEDNIINPLGVKGVGEIGVIGVASAIANAIFHATGKRVKDFPITLDKLL